MIPITKQHAVRQTALHIPLFFEIMMAPDLQKKFSAASALRKGDETNFVRVNIYSESKYLLRE
jgi:hypothetical protein